MTSGATRLIREHKAYLRSMQMSADEVIVFVEGPLDRAVISLLASKVPKAESTRISFRASRELGTSAEGKSALLVFYQYLKRSKKLSSILGSNRTVALFILDRDALGIRTSKHRCPHLEQTIHYAIENYLYRCGNLREAVVAATGLDYASADQHFGDEWLSKAARRWETWCIFCLFCNEHNVRISATFSSGSRFHDAFGNPHTNEEARLMAAAQAKYLNAKIPDFKDAYDVIAKRVSRLFRAKSWDRIFPGKWYGLILEAESKRLAGTRGHLPGNLAEKITSCLLTSVNWQSEELSHLKSAIERAIELVRQDHAP